MRLKRMPILIAIFMVAVLLSGLPAFAWYWPIFGFGPGPCPPPSPDPVPGTILPGTFDWAYMPPAPAHLVQPGYAFGLDAFLHNRIRFGPVPVFETSGAGPPGPGNETQGNKTIGNTTLAGYIR